MKIAVMQPYFFPYLGYWQLINAVDLFIVYDDVNYIKGGWVNRNRILINGGPSFITVPLKQSSPNKKICDLVLLPSARWRAKILKTIENAYRRAPFFHQVYPIFSEIIQFRTDSLSDFLIHQLKTISGFIGIDTPFETASLCCQNNHLSGQDRIIDICKGKKATTYINAIGGKHLYSFSAFKKLNMNLCFIKMKSSPYKQRSSGFVPNLSVLDTLMEIGPFETLRYLERYELICN